MHIVISLDECQSVFLEKYGNAQTTISAPGRANIIGEHTDYNDGYVLPFAIDRYVHFVAALSSDEFSKVFSVNFEEEVILREDEEYSGFAGFLQSCLSVLKEEHYSVSTFDLVFGGDLPIGGGMSSSSALCCGFVAMISRLNNLNLRAADILRIVIRAEKGVSVDGGIMDQFSIINGKNNHAILLDCQDNSMKYIPLILEDFCFCLIDSGVSHNLQETAYDDRVLTCRTALSKLKNINSKIKGFRDIEISDIDQLSELERKRIQHVIEENERVLKSVQCLENNDFRKLGILLNESHISLRDNYEVSSRELDLIVDLLENEKGCLGARMMGGGFGGSVISLMKADRVDEIMSQISQTYLDSVGIKLVFHKVRSSDGLGVSL